MQFELSICIPTYNRATYLKEALDSIINQLDDSNRDNVEICVSDNASEDNTKDVVESYISKHPHITYFRWDKNMGADNNYLKVIEIAHGKYSWFLGSDDVFEQGAINKMLYEIEKDENIDIFCVNFRIYDINLKNPRISKYGMWKQKTDIIFDNVSECIKAMGEIFGYLSIFAFKKEKWMKYAQGKKYIGSAYSHNYIFYSILKYGGTLKYIAHTLVGNRSGNDSFLSEGRLRRITIDILGYNDIPSEIFGKKSEEFKYLNKIILNKFIFLGILGAIISNTASLKYRFKVLILTFKYYRTYISYWFKILPLLMTPAFIIKLLRFLYGMTIKRYTVKA